MSISDKRHRIQISIDRDRQNRQKIEESLGQLMAWHYNLESTIEEIYSDLFVDDEELLMKCIQPVDRWPFETLRPPLETAATSCLWSEEINDLISIFKTKSIDFGQRRTNGVHLPPAAK